MIALRPARREDREVLSAWAVDSSVRKIPAAPSPFRHYNFENWLNGAIADPNTILWLAVNPEGSPVGHIQFVVDSGVAVVSVSVDTGVRGRGFGTEMIIAATRRLFATTNVSRVEAYIRADNVAGLRAFSKSGYKQEASPGAQTSSPCCYTMRRTLLLSGHQPVYLPGIILFNKIAISDIFMFVGHCQYLKKSWHSRNRVRLGERELWLSIPVRTAGQFYQAINDAEFVNDVWKRKHLGSIRQAYKKAPFYDAYYPELERLLLQPWRKLGDLNIALIRLIAGWLEINTPLVDSRSYPITGTKTEMLISMCRAVSANGYLSNEGSIVYVDEERLAEAGIHHCWQKFEHPSYDQEGIFMPSMSIIDLLFRAGPKARDVVRNCGRVSPGAFAPRLCA